VEFRQLRSFVAVAEELHFGRAALRLGMTQQGVSLHVRALERELGLVLFERGGRPIALTQSGVELLPRARELLSLARRAALEVRAAATHSPGILRVGVVHEGLAELTGPALALFRAGHPDVRVLAQALDYADLPAALTDGRVSVVLGCTQAGADSLQRTGSPVSWQPVFADRRSVVLPVGHALADADVLHVRDLAHERWLRVAGMPSEWVDVWTLSEQRNGEPVPRVVSDADTMGDLLRDVVRFDAVITVTSATSRYYRSSRVRYVPLLDVPRLAVGVAAPTEQDDPWVRELQLAVERTADLHLGLVPHGLRVR